MLLGQKGAMALAGLLTLLVAFGSPLAAQDNQDTDMPADSQLAGAVYTTNGTAIPGSTVRAIQTSTRKAWVTWTDDNGKFEFPALPAGHFRIEISQLGFAPSTREIDLASGTKTHVDLKMDVGTLAEISASPTTENAEKPPGIPPSNESVNSAAPGTPAAS